MTETAGPSDRADLLTRASSGRRARLLIAFACGLALTAAQPPVFAWPLVFLAVPALVQMTFLGARRQAFWTGWAAGFGFFLSGLYWIAEAFFVDFARHGWMAPFAVAFMAGGLALFWGGAFWAARAAGARGWAAGLSLAAALAAAEYLRSHAFTGFPWALPAYAFAASPIAQLSAYAGPHALGFAALALAAIPYAAHRLGRGRATWTGLAVCAAVAAAGVAAAHLVGTARLAEGARPAPDAPVVRVVQPNAPQSQKWRPELMPVFFNRLRALSGPDHGPPADIVVWPETAVPQLLGRDAEARAAVAASAQGATVLVGARRFIQAHERASWRNSLFAVSPTGEALAVYDKHHLVPFGEYLPLHGLLSRLGLGAFVGESGGFDGGPGPLTLDLPGLPSVAPQICYETIFPHQMPRAADRPDWIVQITNDAWFGASAGPWQHFHQARMRAIEQGLPVIRSANTGVSAIIDAHGRVVAQVDLLEAGATQAPLPPALSSTPYARFGDWPFLLGLGGAAALIAAGRRAASP